MVQSDRVIRRLRALLLVLSCVVLAATALAPALALADDPHAISQQSSALPEHPEERAVFARLVAPCCWNQTLEAHQGSAPDSLRAEIRQRLHAGETREAIEKDFVARYGPAVIASSHSTSLSAAALVVIAFAIIAGVALIFMVRRWLRRSRAQAAAAAAGVPAGPPEHDDLDDRIDDELRHM